jgi:hypothetical protein
LKNRDFRLFVGQPPHSTLNELIDRRFDPINPSISSGFPIAFPRFSHVPPLNFPSDIGIPNSAGFQIQAPPNVPPGSMLIKEQKLARLE